MSPIVRSWLWSPLSSFVFMEAPRINEPQGLFLHKLASFKNGNREYDKKLLTLTAVHSTHSGIHFRQNRVLRTIFESLKVFALLAVLIAHITTSFILLGKNPKHAVLHSLADFPLSTTSAENIWGGKKPLHSGRIIELDLEIRWRRSDLKAMRSLSLYIFCPGLQSSGRMSCKRPGN